MTDEELDAIEARLNAATPGPWVASCENDHNIVCCPLGGWLCEMLGFGGNSERNATFIAHAPEDIKLLLAEVRRLHKITPY